MKKILNTILVLALLVLVPAFFVNAEDAKGTNDDIGEIIVNGAIDDKEYHAYQILVLESYDTSKDAYTYKVADGWEGFFTTGKGAEYVDINTAGAVTWKDGKDTATDMKTFAQEALKYATKEGITGIDPDEGQLAKWTNLNLGYYLIDSSVGALCSLTTTIPKAEANEKNSVPTVEKEVKKGEEDFAPSNTASIGDTLKFKTTINVKAGAENYILYDKMSEGLTFSGVSSIKVYKNGLDTADEVNESNYTASLCDGTEPLTCTFKVDFTETYEASLVDGDKIYVTYTAILNEKAIIAGDGNINDTWLNYGDNNNSVHDTTTTKTYEFDLVKTDNTFTLLGGAEFKLFDDLTGGNEIAVVEDGEGIYRVAKDGENGVSIVVTNGKVTIRGLANGTYYLQETVAPDGYNMLTERKAITIDDANNNATITPLPEADSEGHVNSIEGGLHVINLTGDMLPTTGGMGTMLFVIIGSVMVLGFGVLLVTKLRISKMSA